MKLKLILILCLALFLFTGGCQRTIIPKPAVIPVPPNAKVVCIFFDDGFQNQYDVALPILLENNFKATFGIITDYINKGRDLMKYMDTDKITELAKLGMDIASHSKTHLDLKNLNDEQLRDEVISSKQALENLGFQVSTLVYPYYEYDDRAIDYAIAANYTCARGGWSEDRVYNLNTSDSKARYHVAAWQISNQTLNEFKAILDNSKPNSAICLVYHFIADDGPKDTSTPVANFKEQMAYLKSAGYVVVPLPDLFRQ